LTAVTAKNLLAQSPIFQDLDPGLIERLFAEGERRRLIDGDLLFRFEQEYTREIYIIIEGEIVIQRTDGQTYTVRPGDFVGLSSFLDQAPYSATAFSRGKVDLLALPEQVFHAIKQDFPELSTAINRSISERIRRWNPGRRGTTGVLIQPVRSFMTVPFAACRAETTLEAALNIMRNRMIGSLGVTHGDGRLYGLVTPQAIAETVIVRRNEASRSLAETGVEEVYTISPDEQL